MQKQGEAGGSYILWRIWGSKVTEFRVLYFMDALSLKKFFSCRPWNAAEPGLLLDYMMRQLSLALALIVVSRVSGFQRYQK